MLSLRLSFIFQKFPDSTKIFFQSILNTKCSNTISKIMNFTQTSRFYLSPCDEICESNKRSVSINLFIRPSVPLSCDTYL